MVQQTGTPSLVLRGQNGPQQFRVTRTFPNIESAYTQTADQVFSHRQNAHLDESNNTLSTYFRRSFNPDSYVGPQFEMVTAFLGILESLGLVAFQTTNGSDSQIYIRINSVRRMEKATHTLHYRNRILEKVIEQHHLNVAMLDHVFTTEAPGQTDSERNRNYTTWFWNEIENFFFGIIPPEV